MHHNQSAPQGSLHCSEESPLKEDGSSCCATPSSAFNDGMSTVAEPGPETPGCLSNKRHCSMRRDDVCYDQQLLDQEGHTWTAFNRAPAPGCRSQTGSVPVPELPEVFAGSTGQQPAPPAAWAGVSASLRAAAVDWMVDAAWQLVLSQEALHLGVQLLDRYLADCPPCLASPAAPPARLQLLGLACLWTAAKYEEASAPSAASCLQVLCAGLPSAPMGQLQRQLVSQERQLLAAVGYRLSLPTTHTFLQRALLRAPLSLDEACLASYLADVCLLERALLRSLPSKVAAACYVWAVVLTGRQLAADEVQAATGYAPDQLQGELLWVAELHATVCGAQRDCAVRLKYCSAEMRRVALLPLARRRPQVVRTA